MRTPGLFSSSSGNARQSLLRRVMGRRGMRGGEGGAYGLALALGVLALGPLVGYHIASSYRGEMASWQTRQSSVADDRALRLEDWLKKRLAYAELFSTRPSVRTALRAYDTSVRLPGRPRGGRPDLTGILDEMVRLYPYAGVYVLDRNGQVVAQSSHAVPLNPALAAACQSAVRARAMRIDLLGEAPDKTLIGFSVPVFSEPGAAEARPSPGQPLGVALLVFDAAHTLFPILTREDMPTRTGETILVRHEGNEIVFFSPLRRVPAGSPNLRFSLSTAPLPARAAGEGRELFGEFRDYRGVPVLAATRRIELTGWGLVRTIDRTEALEDFRRMAIVEGLAAGLLVMLLAGLLIFHRRHALTRVTEREEKKFGALLESAPDAVVIVDKEGKIILVNAQTETMFGFERQELAGQPIETLVPEGVGAKSGEDRPRKFAELAAQHRGVTVEMRGSHKDGTEFPLEARLSPIETAEGVLVFCGIRDITERKQAEEALAASEVRYRRLFEAAKDGILILDAETGLIVDVNPFLIKLLGASHEHFLKKHIWDLGFFVDILANKASFEELQRKEYVRYEDLPLKTADGRPIDVEFVSNVYHVDGKKVIQCNVRDITERKRAEDEILKLNRELEEKVAARTADLLATNKELEAFTYSVSHDLRAPLRHVDGFSKLLQEEHGKELSAVAQAYLSTIRNAVLRMGLLIDDLLSLARVGRTELSVRETGLNSLVEEVMADLKRANPQRAIEWKVETLPFVECDPALMKQVFANLLSNAVKFTRPRKPAEIVVGATGQDGRQVVFVRDNGVGFSMKYADKLFGVFQRLHRAEDFEGTGVGLATVQRIIHKHGGRIWAEAELNKGATFYFMLGTPEGRGTES